MARVLVLAASRAVQGRLFFPLDEHVADSADAGGVLRHPSASAHWKAFESSGADVPVDASGIAGREAMMRGVPVQDGLAVDVVKEGRRMVRREFAVAEPYLKALVCNGIDDGSRMRVLHPEDLGEVIHFDVLCCPPVEFDTWIVVLVTRHVSRLPSQRASRDHRAQSAE